MCVCVCVCVWWGGGGNSNLHTHGIFTFSVILRLKRGKNSATGLGMNKSGWSAASRVGTRGGSMGGAPAITRKIIISTSSSQKYCTNLVEGMEQAFRNQAQEGGPRTPWVAFHSR